ncbi:putative sodium/metabolite cotransporter BASS4, chloroplastic isoform B [Glycine soja]|uniref:Putative sodium/metabolite cotransporter BASS4, chloroplastic isoform B n=1 Tax=Glycine soja TaxID=3848 RepID=A0A445IKY7_GLYSO|nr:putative sodium/metabolite cotransporter BASS4, chloroplastic isoform B [Glycine soja]
MGRFYVNLLKPFNLYLSRKILSSPFFIHLHQSLPGVAWEPIVKKQIPLPGTNRFIILGPCRDKLCRAVGGSGVADFVDKNRKLFTVISALFLSLVPWTQVSRSRSLLLMVKPSVFLVAIGLGTLLHLSLLVFNILAVWGLSVISGGKNSIFSREQNASALVLVASQKTLPVMVAVIEPLRGAFGESGLLVLPCVAAHLNQIILDTFIVNFLRPQDNSNNVKVA